MDANKIIQFMDNSFLRDLLLDVEVTDISYNGREFFFLHNHFGRQMAFIDANKDEVKDFVRQIAYMSEQQFSFSNPILDVSFGRYRFNAVHQTIGKVDNADAITFSLRIGSTELHIKNDGNFFPKAVGELIDVLVESGQSIVIAGTTGSGKTEFQKYIITRMEESSRIIIIDNVLELDIHSLGDNLDLNIWQADEKTKYSTIPYLVKNALRSNPDWLIVAESRGAEMIDVLNSVMTGHPIITTIHSQDAFSVPNRMARMVMMNEKKMSFEDVYKDILNHFHIFFYLKRRRIKGGRVIRFVSSIVEYDSLGRSKEIYKRKGDQELYKPLSIGLVNNLENYDTKESFIKTFVEAN